MGGRGDKSPVVPQPGAGPEEGAAGQGATSTVKTLEVQVRVVSLLGASGWWSCGVTWYVEA